MNFIPVGAGPILFNLDTAGAAERGDHLARQQGAQILARRRCVDRAG